MTIKSDFKLAVLDRGRNEEGLTQRREGAKSQRILAGQNLAGGEHSFSRPFLTVWNFAALWLRAFALKFLPLPNWAPPGKSYFCRFLSLAVAYCRLLSLTVALRMGVGRVLRRACRRPYFNSVPDCSLPTQIKLT